MVTRRFHFLGHMLVANIFIGFAAAKIAASQIKEYHLDSCGAINRALQCQPGDLLNYVADDAPTAPHPETNNGATRRHCSFQMTAQRLSIGT